MTLWASKYVGLPFLDHGRDFNGVDCWGLVQLVMRIEKKILLPCYGETSALDLAKVAGLIQSESAIEPWLQVNEPQAFDVVVMHKRLAPIHVGIMADQNQLLHVEEKTSAVMVPIGHDSIRFRSQRFFRHRALA